jgi:hypothetical protein
MASQKGPSISQEQKCPRIFTKSHPAACPEGPVALSHSLTIHLSHTHTHTHTPARGVYNAHRHSIDDHHLPRRINLADRSKYTLGHYFAQTICISRHPGPLDCTSLLLILNTYLATNYWSKTLNFAAFFVFLCIYITHGVLFFACLLIFRVFNVE